MRRAPFEAIAAAAALCCVCLLTGCTAGPSSAVVSSSPSPSSLDPRAVAASVIEDDAAHTLVMLPRAQSGRLVVYLHGGKEDEDTVLDGCCQPGVASALLNAGYIVASARAGGDAWGDPQSVDEYVGFIRSLEARYRIADVFLIAESMGGLAAAQMPARIPGVRAIVAWYPVLDLRTVESEFPASVARAWADGGISTVSPVDVPAVPVAVWASPDDTVVSKERNADEWVARARALGVQALERTSSGDHGDRSNFDARAVLEFFEAHR